MNPYKGAKYEPKYAFYPHIEAPDGGIGFQELFAADTGQIVNGSQFGTVHIEIIGEVAFRDDQAMARCERVDIKDAEGLSHSMSF